MGRLIPRPLRARGSSLVRKTLAVNVPLKCPPWLVTLVVNLPSDSQMSKDRNASQLALGGRGGFWLLCPAGWASLSVLQPCSPLCGFRSLLSSLHRQPEPWGQLSWTSHGPITAAGEILCSDGQASSSAHLTWTKTGAGGSQADSRTKVRRWWTPSEGCFVHKSSRNHSKRLNCGPSVPPTDMSTSQNL